MDDDGWTTVGQKPQRPQRAHQKSKSNRNQKSKNAPPKKRAPRVNPKPAVVSPHLVEQPIVSSTNEPTESPQRETIPKIPLKTATEYGWSITELRRLATHVETLGNYSKSGAISSLKEKWVHNSETREQNIYPLAESKLTQQEQNLLEYLSSNLNLQLDEESDTLLAFLSIFLASIAHTRFYSKDKNIDNYWHYHDKFEGVKVWNNKDIPTTLSEYLKRELQEKLNNHPQAIDSSTLQKHLCGKLFKFTFPGNLSVPYCLQKLAPHVNLNQIKMVNQRRFLYRYEHKGGASRGPTNQERPEWQQISGLSKEYKVQVETFENEFLNGDGSPVLGVTNFSTLLHTIYTSLLKIKKPQQPTELIANIKKLLIALPNLIDLPDLLLKIHNENFAGYENIELHPDLSDYASVKNRLLEILKREGVKPQSENADGIRDTLNAIINFNHSEEDKLRNYQKKNTDEESNEKGYPLNPQFIRALIGQLEMDDDEYSKYNNELSQLKKLKGLKHISNELSQSDQPQRQQSSSERFQFDEME